MCSGVRECKFSCGVIGFSSSGLCDKKEVKFDRTGILGGEGSFSGPGVCGRFSVMI